MRFSWIDPRRKDAKIVVAIMAMPKGSFADSKQVRPATVELNNGHLVEVPLVLCESAQDVMDMAELVLTDMKNGVPNRAMPPTKKKAKRGRPPKVKS